MPLVSTWRAISSLGVPPSKDFAQPVPPPQTPFFAGPPWPPGTFLVAITREDEVSGSSLEDAALGTSERQAKPKTKGFGEPCSLEKEVRCFSLVDVSFYS